MSPFFLSTKKPTCPPLPREKTVTQPTTGLLIFFPQSSQSRAQAELLPSMATSSMHQLTKAEHQKVSSFSLSGDPRLVLCRYSIMRGLSPGPGTSFTPISPRATGIHFGSPPVPPATIGRSQRIAHHPLRPLLETFTQSWAGLSLVPSTVSPRFSAPFICALISGALRMFRLLAVTWYLRGRIF